ncbi:arginine deiminase family protein [Virgibacillus sp. MG-45]|uniref:arginine deiminase family protein n=1 Tax=Virgibacillus sp. MG-45 TaxID=3102791 RepID=UPI002ED98344
MSQLHPFCWNEYDTLKTVIICSPSKLTIPDQQTAKDIQWEQAVDHQKATENFEQLTSTLTELGVRVIDYAVHLPHKTQSFHEQLVNRYFVRDLACVFGETILPGKAGTSMRQPEYELFHPILETWIAEPHFQKEANNGWRALEFGDVLVLNKDAILINTGLRTSIDSIRSMKDFLFRAGFSEIGVVDLPRRADTLHLDMNCNVTGENTILAKSYMRFLPVQIITDQSSTYKMFADYLKRHQYDVIWTSAVQNTVADINFLNIDPETILVSSQHTKEIFKNDITLTKKKRIEIDVTELEKGGGGIRCMTLPIERRK